ncbi:MAG: cation-translocating P-type ATPase [Planctomycetaceae bacterium]|nr:cation-translocating P-type ATPase [Planctomycetaceae bacterium]
MATEVSWARKARISHPSVKQLEIPDGELPPSEPGAATSADPWHAVDVNAAVRLLETDAEQGLDAQQVSRQTARFGANELASEPPTPWWSLVLGQLREIVVILLLVAGVIAAALGEWLDATAILLIIALNAALGLYQHFKSERALAALRNLAAPMARVVRLGEARRVPSRELVPGDRIELEAGDSIPADIRLLKSYQFETHEAALTGESTPVEKDHTLVLGLKTPLGDRRNMVYLGSLATRGRASGVVVATGMQTELGRVAGMLRNQKPPTPLLVERISRLGRNLVVICIILVGVIAALQLLRGQSWLDTLQLAVSLAVAAVPEGLPAVLTITLAIGAQRLAQRSALIRKLASVETLGSVTTICSDKTGTLTRNEMTVQEVVTSDQSWQVTGVGYAPDGDVLRQAGGQDQWRSRTNGDARCDQTTTTALELARAASIGLWCNNATVERAEDEAHWQAIGDPTEAALVVLARKVGVVRDSSRRIVHESPFDSERKMMSVVTIDLNSNYELLVKGAPESILAVTTRQLRAGGVAPMRDEDRSRIRGYCEEMAGRALRVLALAYRPANGASDAKEDELVFAGLVGMIDPPRAEAQEAVSKCHAAGIRPVMITGDHPATARAIGRALGILSEQGEVAIGQDIDSWPDAKLLEQAPRIDVYARVSPESKLRIVHALQKRGNVVAMTGDGVNDAPAVKAADIGIAMGITGTDATKEASAMILLNDNFATIVAAVEEGRRIYANIQRFVHYLLAGNAGKLMFMFAATLLSWPAPLLAIQVLWLNLITDGLPALALGAEKSGGGLMEQPPRGTNEPLIGRRRAFRILWHGGLTALSALVGFFLVYQHDAMKLAEAQVVAFCVLGFAQLAYALSCRSDRETLFELGAASNRALLAATGASSILQLAVILIPACHQAFGVEAYPTLGEWALIGVLSILPALIIEVTKKLGRSRNDAAAS